MAATRPVGEGFGSGTVSVRAYSDMPAISVLHYQYHALDAAAVIAELVALAEQFKQETRARR